MSSKITLSIPDELLKEFKKEFPEINVGMLARRVILEKVNDLKKLQELKSKGVI